MVCLAIIKHTWSHFCPTFETPKKSRKRHLKRKRKIHFSIYAEIVKTAERSNKKNVHWKESEKTRQRIYKVKIFISHSLCFLTAALAAWKQHRLKKKKKWHDLAKRERKVIWMGNDSRSLCCSRDLWIKVTHAFNWLFTFCGRRAWTIGEWSLLLLSTVTSTCNWKETFGILNYTVSRCCRPSRSC